MFETLLNSAYEAGSEVFVFMNGFANPLRGRVQDISSDYFTFFQTGKQGTVLWAFRMSDVISCGLLVGLPGEASSAPIREAQAEGVSFNESDHLN